LIGQHRLQHYAGTVAARHHQLVRLNRFQQAGGVQIGHDLLARFIAIQSAIGGGRLVVDFCVQRQNINRRQIVPLSYRIVVEIMRGRDFDAAGAEFLIDIAIDDDGNLAIT
jgi:hypothetical protein